MDNYIKVRNCCISNNCTLLTSFEDFEEKRKLVVKLSYHYVRIDFIGVCGHNSSAVCTNFITRRTGIMCKICTKDKMKKIGLTIGKDVHYIEYNSIKIIEQYLSKEYEVVRTKEGCKADLIIRKYSEINKYFPIQLKSTTSMSHKMYSFRGINKSYDNMIIICICTSEKKIWVIPYEDIKHLINLNISTTSKYNKYLVSDNNLLSDSIIKCMPIYYDNILGLNTPISILQQREQEYVRKREKYINFLTYIYPDIQNTVTDFIVNGKKVQEKVCGYPKDNKTIATVWLASYNGKKQNRTRNSRTYCLGENDYYWFHSQRDDKFWIIPEHILYDNGYIADTNEIKNRTCLYINPKTNTWIKEYEYDYNNINIPVIQELFK
jgi:hypothetical protein